MIFGWLDDHDALEADYQPECRARFDVAFLATGVGMRQTASLDAAPGSLNNVVVVGGLQAVGRALGLLEAGSATHVTLISPSRFYHRYARSAASEASLATTVRRLSDQRPTYGTGLQFVRYLATVR